MTVALRGEAAHVFQQLRPAVPDDDTYGDTAAHLCAALMAPVEDVTEWAADQEDGTTGWAMVMNLQTCPPFLLSWLGRFRGVVIPPGTDHDEARRLIGEAHGFQRGTRTGLISDVQTTLTGTRNVRVLERHDGPHTALVITRPSETSNPTATLAAARDRRRKPLGVLITHDLSEAPLIDEMTRTIDALSGTIDTLTLADVT